MILLKRWKRRNRSSRSKSPSLKRLKRRRPKAEFIIGARCIGIRPDEPGIGARCIGIRAIEPGVKAPRIPICDGELPRGLICAVAIETAKTHATTQVRRTNFLQFIASQVPKDRTPGDSKVAALERIKGSGRVTFSPWETTTRDDDNHLLPAQFT